MNMRTLWDNKVIIDVEGENLYGEVTRQAAQCSCINAPRVPKTFIRIMALVKYACGAANGILGCIEKRKAEVIQRIALEIYEGKWDKAFPLEIFQSGGCTPTHMNLNEVIAGIAHKNYHINLHPNDDCNYGQSTNDVIPTALNIALYEKTQAILLPAMEFCYSILEEKGKAWEQISILGRTHTMDAVPMTLGQIFGGYSRQIEKNIENIKNNLEHFLELPIGGTAVGNGLNSHPDFGLQVVELINKRLQRGYMPSSNRFEQQSSRDDYVFFAGLLDTLSTTLIKISNDIRWYGSGPEGGLHELILPKTHAGSSFMPGKINPVVCETLIQACIYVQGNCDCIRRCAVIGSQFQLNTASMLIIYAILESIRILAQVLNLFTKFVLEGLQPNYKKIKEHLNTSCARLMVLVPFVGYDLATEIVSEAQLNNLNFKEIIQKKCAHLSKNDLKKILDLL